MTITDNNNNNNNHRLVFPVPAVFHVNNEHIFVRVFFCSPSREISLAYHPLFDAKTSKRHHTTNQRAKKIVNMVVEVARTFSNANDAVQGLNSHGETEEVPNMTRDPLQRLE